MNNLTEAEVRALRDRVYGPTTDKNWEECKTEWLKPEEVKWLRETCAALDRKV